MAGVFPSAEWLDSVVDKLNSDEKYARVAHNWEGDMNFVIDPGGALTAGMQIYLDLWHGQCRSARVVTDGALPEAAFTLQATYDNYVRVLKGQLDPIQAMLMRKLAVKGNMAYIMRNVPVVLDFVRCLREVTDTYLETA
ncbi:MAG: SCP2 sterol-binding domain-containing protein [Anaerolineales bacterium]